MSYHPYEFFHDVSFNGFHTHCMEGYTMNHIHALKSFHLLGFISSTTWIMGEDPSSYTPYMKMLSPRGFISHIISIKWNFSDDDSLELL
jgi:hypothetical protein